MKLSVVIPARNEAARHRGDGRRDSRAPVAASGIAYEILVVDDGSDDATSAEVQARAAIDAGVRARAEPGPHGFGRAVRLGLERFTGDAVVIVHGGRIRRSPTIS